MIRTLTVRRADSLSREIAIDVSVHGDHGVVGPWPAVRSPAMRCT